MGIGPACQITLLYLAKVAAVFQLCEDAMTDGIWQRRLRYAAASGIAKQRHETEIHVLLHVTVEQGQSRMLG